MRLFIAEKPSLARAIAEALPGPQRRAATCIECGPDDVVAWCVGHILEPAPPEAYGYETWRLDALPIAPTDWKLSVTAPELLSTIKRRLKHASRVVHAGDPDREGQLLVDEVIRFVGYRGPVDRLLLRDLTPASVSAALSHLEPNDNYRRMSDAALARQRADWLFGMNLSRLYTLLGRAGGYGGVLSVGRVQTPLLGLIVARDKAIATFTPKPYYVVEIEASAGGGGTFRARWAPPDGEHLDEDRRLVDRALAEAVRVRTAGKSGRVAVATEDKKSEPPPLPYSLADLQVDAGKRLSMSAKKVLDVCQSLYETHRVITYPRSDCAYLPEAHHGQAKAVLASIEAQLSDLARAVAGASLTLRSKAFSDKKVTAHHAIVPTPSARPASLSGEERAVYELVARRYVAQFYGAHAYLLARIELEIAADRFVATGRTLVALGWKEVIGVVEEADGRKEDDEGREPLPRLSVGQAVTAQDARVMDKRTTAAKPFTDASLIAAMCGVAKFVSDPAAKKLLTEADGIGTPATRAAILETLFERGFVVRDKKAIVSTATGRAFVASLPPALTTPDMTAIWEAALRAIEGGHVSLDGFLERVSAQLAQLVAEGRALGRITVPGAPAGVPVRPSPSPHRRQRRARSA